MEIVKSVSTDSTDVVFDVVADFNLTWRAVTSSALARPANGSKTALAAMSSYSLYVQITLAAASPNDVMRMFLSSCSS